MRRVAPALTLPAAPRTQAQGLPSSCIFRLCRRRTFEAIRRWRLSAVSGLLPLAHITQVESHDQLVSALLHAASMLSGGRPTIFLSFFRSTECLGAIDAVGVNMERITGFGVPLAAEALTNRDEIFLRPKE